MEDYNDIFSSAELKVYNNYEEEQNNWQKANEEIELYD